MPPSLSFSMISPRFLRCLDSSCCSLASHSDSPLLILVSSSCILLASSFFCSNINSTIHRAQDGQNCAKDKRRRQRRCACKRLTRRRGCVKGKRKDERDDNRVKGKERYVVKGEEVTGIITDGSWELVCSSLSLSFSHGRSSLMKQTACKCTNMIQEGKNWFAPCDRWIEIIERGVFLGE